MAGTERIGLALVAQGLALGIRGGKVMIEHGLMLFTVKKAVTDAAQ